MTSLLPWIGLGVLVVTAYLSALHLALLQVSGTMLERRLQTLGRQNAALWLLPRVRFVAQDVALLRSLGRAAFLTLIIARAIGLDRPTPPPPTWTGVLLAGLVGALILWICTSVLAAALAEHASVGLVAYGARLLRVMHVVTMPVHWVYRVIDESVRRLSGANLAQEDPEDELLASIEDSQREGGLDDMAATLLENVVEFTSTGVSEVMTPRTDIEGIEYADDLPSIRRFINEAGHSRIPVYGENLDEILGILYVKDLVAYLGEEANGFSLRPLLREPIRVPETKPVSELLKDFQKSEVHMAIVIDEYGGTSGLVTIEDVLEEIVGEIRDEHESDDEEEPSLDRVGERRVEIDGRFRIDQLNEELDLELPDEEFDTVAGLVLAWFGRVPEVGERFVADGIAFEVLGATPTQVTRVLIDLVPASPPARVAQEG